MKLKDKTIIITGSGKETALGKISKSNHSGYCVSKFAVKAFSEALRSE